MFLRLLLLCLIFSWALEIRWGMSFAHCLFILFASLGAQVGLRATPRWAYSHDMVVDDGDGGGAGGDACCL